MGLKVKLFAPLAIWTCILSISRSARVDMKINLGGESVDGFAAEKEFLDLGDEIPKMRFHGIVKGSGTDLNVFKTQRFARSEDLVLNIPVPDGVYTVSLLFAETWKGAFAAGKRVFDVYMGSKPNGIVKVCDSLDPFRSGGPAAPVRRKFRDVATQGGLTIALRPIKQNPQIAGVIIDGYSYSDALLEDLPAVPSSPTDAPDFSILNTVGPRVPADVSLLYDPSLNPKFNNPGSGGLLSGYSSSSSSASSVSGINAAPTQAYPPFKRASVGIAGGMSGHSAPSLSTYGRFGTGGSSGHFPPSALLVRPQVGYHRRLASYQDHQQRGTDIASRLESLNSRISQEQMAMESMKNSQIVPGEAPIPQQDHNSFQESMGAANNYLGTVSAGSMDSLPSKQEAQSGSTYPMGGSLSSQNAFGAQKNELGASSNARTDPLLPQSAPSFGAGSSYAGSAPGSAESSIERQSSSSSARQKLLSGLHEATQRLYQAQLESTQEASSPLTATGPAFGSGAQAGSLDSMKAVSPDSSGGLTGRQHESGAPGLISQNQPDTYYAGQGATDIYPRGMQALNMDQSSPDLTVPGLANPQRTALSGNQLNSGTGPASTGFQTPYVSRIVHDSPVPNFGVSQESNPIPHSMPHGASFESSLPNSGEAAQQFAHRPTSPRAGESLEPDAMPYSGAQTASAESGVPNFGEAAQLSHGSSATPELEAYGSREGFHADQNAYQQSPGTSNNGLASPRFNNGGFAKNSETNPTSFGRGSMDLERHNTATGLNTGSSLRENPMRSPMVGKSSQDGLHRRTVRQTSGDSPNIPLPILSDIPGMEEQTQLPSDTPGIHNGNNDLDGLCIDNSTHCSCGMAQQRGLQPEECLFIVNREVSPMICERRPCSGRFICACAAGANALCKRSSVHSILVTASIHKHGVTESPSVVFCRREEIEQGVGILTPIL